MASMPEIKLNKETLGLVIACFSVAGTCFGVYNWLLSGRAENAPVVRELITAFSDSNKLQALKDQDQDARLDRGDRRAERQTEATKELTGETKRLNDAVVKLTTVIEQQAITKKADYTPSFNDYPNRTITIGNR